VHDYFEEGFGDYNSMFFYGEIELINRGLGEDRWNLNRHKNGFDELGPLLKRELFGRIEPLLKEMQNETEKIVFPNINNHQYPMEGRHARPQSYGHDNGSPLKIGVRDGTLDGQKLIFDPKGDEYFERKKGKPNRPSRKRVISKVHPLNFRRRAKRKIKTHGDKSAICVAFRACGVAADMITIVPREDTIEIIFNTDHKVGAILAKEKERVGASSLAISAAIHFCETRGIKDGRFPFYEQKDEDRVKSYQKNVGDLLNGYQINFLKK
jgi:hypothetical protein